MSFIFLNTEGTALKGSEFASLGSSLETQEVDIIVYNNDSVKAESPVIFLQPSSDLGSLAYPSKRPPHTDYGDLLLWGATLDEVTNEPKSGLYLKKGDEKIYFSLNAGSNYRNGIPLDPIEAEASITIKIGFTPELNDNIRRIYVGIEVYDSRTNI